MGKRLGIAQLCLLLAVLVFLSLTRGSRSEMVDHRLLGTSLRSITGGSSSFREWRERNMSFRGDWVGRFRSRSRSHTPTPGESTPVGRDPDDTGMPFPRHAICARHNA